MGVFMENEVSKSKKPTVAISMKAKHYALSETFKQFPEAQAFYNKTWEEKKAELKAVPA